MRSVKRRLRAGMRVQVRGVRGVGVIHCLGGKVHVVFPNGDSPYVGRNQIRGEGKPTKRDRIEWGRMGYHQRRHNSLSQKRGAVQRQETLLLPGVRVERCVYPCSLVVVSTPAGHPFSMAEVWSFANVAKPRFYDRLLRYYLKPHSKQAQTAAARAAFRALAKGK